MNPCNYFLWGHLKDNVYHTKLHTVQELQAETSAAAEEITGYDSVLHLQQGYEVKDLILNVLMKTTSTQNLHENNLLIMHHLLLYPTKLQIYYTSKLLHISLNNLYLEFRAL
jgi:hypothetical protein